MTARMVRSPVQRATVGTGLRVGVTVFLRDGNQSIWENGIHQNVFVLATLLEQVPTISRTYIVNGGPGDPTEAGKLLESVSPPIISLREAMDELDLVIELSAQLDPDWARAFRAKGGFVIGMRVANDFVIDAERMAFGLPHAMLMSGTPYNEIWTLPAFRASCATYYGSGYRAPVRVMPHLWSPVFLEQAVKAQGLGAFQYVPGRKRWRLAVMEANICSVKSCHLPLLLADVAHRNDSRFIEHVRVYCSLELKTSSNFVTYARGMDLVCQGLATFEGRFPPVSIMGHMADAIISHHWLNGQNYLYYEALYGGFPLIHNSNLIADCGYRYTDFDPESGALALLQAFREHDRNLEDYKARCSRFLATLDPLNPDNIHAFSAAISAVTKDSRS